MEPPQFASDATDTRTLDARPAPHPGGSLKPRRRWRMFLGAIVVAGIPLAYVEFPREVARWHVAAALEHYNSGDQIGALKSLKRAGKWDPNAREMFESYALRECNLALRGQPQQPEVYLHRSSIYHFLGRHQEAVEDCELAVELVTTQFAQEMSLSLNGLAYARALNKSELDSALQDVEKALELTKPNAPMLDTRGYLHFLRKEYSQARSDLDQAVQLTEAEIRKLEQKPRESAFSSTSRQSRQMAALRSSLAAILYHRAELLEALELKIEAAADRQRIRELGADPEDQLF